MPTAPGAYDRTNHCVAFCWPCILSPLTNDLGPGPQLPHLPNGLGPHGAARTSDSISPGSLRVSQPPMQPPSPGEMLVVGSEHGVCLSPGGWGEDTRLEVSPAQPGGITPTLSQPSLGLSSQGVSSFAEKNCSYFRHFNPGESSEIFEFTTQKGEPGGVRPGGGSSDCGHPCGAGDGLAPKSRPPCSCIRHAMAPSVPAPLMGLAERRGSAWGRSKRSHPGAEFRAGGSESVRSAVPPVPSIAPQESGGQGVWGMHPSRGAPSTCALGSSGGR